MRNTSNRGNAVPLIQGVLFAILVSGFAILMYGQQTPIIKQVPPPAVSAGSGVDMFQAYCVACRNKDGKGNGPAAPALKKAPADLTQLSKKNGGKFPELKVLNVIKGDVAVPSHGSKDMPVWGNVLKQPSRGDSELMLRLGNLTKYVESIQAK